MRISDWSSDVCSSDLTSAKALQDAEIRKGVFRGPFLDLVVECADSELFKSITPHMAKGVDARSERQELVTRFFVYSDRYHAFRHDFRRFLDITLDMLNKTARASDLSRIRDEFIRTMKLTSANFPPAFYRPDSPPRVPR